MSTKKLDIGPYANTRVGAARLKHPHIKAGEAMTKGGTYVVNVTQEDIDDAIANDSHHCAVATAVSRSIPAARLPSADVQTIRFSRNDTGLRYVFLTPASVQDYIVKFDAGEHIEPFSFNLRRPAYCGRRTRRTLGTGRSDITYTAQVEKLTRNEDGDFTAARVKADPPKDRSRRYRSYGLRQMRVNGGTNTDDTLSSTR